MFETAQGSALATWRSPSWPIEKPTPLVRLGEHRREYLGHEGPVSGGRGTVKRIAAGSCALERDADDRFWSIYLDDLAPPLNLRLVAGDDWLAVPACGG
jgi:hypothetical protein